MFSSARGSVLSCAPTFLFQDKCGARVIEKELNTSFSFIDFFSMSFSELFGCIHTRPISIQGGRTDRAVAVASF